MIKSVTDYLDESASKFPNKIAFVDEHESITFSELQHNAYQIAYDIYKRKIIHCPILVFLPKAANNISVFMGIAYSNNFYVPIDIHIPYQRIYKIIQKLKPALIITNKKYKSIFAALNNIQIIDYEESINQQDINKTAVQTIKNNIIDTDVLYILFTSGSTGDPKGVIISHRAVIDYTEWFSNTFTVNDSYIFGNQTPFYFDNSVLDIYQTLKNGSTTYIIPESYFMFPIKLLEYIKVNNINTIFWVPSALRIITEFDVLHKIHMDSIKNIMFCGEVMNVKLLNMWKTEYPDALFVNLYGPTEITVSCSYYIVDREFKNTEVLPIGKACDNTNIFILNEHNKLASIKEVGEICVRGTCLSYGYYNDQQKTDEVFVQNPLQNNYFEKIYRTGDLGYFNDLGELIYVGRKDTQQIKHNGRRIELGEIETAMSSLDGITSNCCIYNNDIIMFYSGKQLPEQELIKQLKTLIPVYMIPSRFMYLQHLPINSNGKIDRIKLQKMI